MNEDLKPCYDIASDWELCPLQTPGIQICQHKDYRELVRIIDFKKQTVTFKDVNRVIPSKVIDIYRKVEPADKLPLMPIVLRVITEEKPISMPYIHEELSVFIQYDGENLGILYYKDSDEERSIIPIKRFFKVRKAERKPLRFDEVTFTEFHRDFDYPYEGREEDVDQTQQGTV